MQAATQLSNQTGLHPLTALRAMIVVTRDPEDTATGALMVQSLSGNSQQRCNERFAQHPMGAQILAEGRRLEEILSDSGRLAALPPDTLGHHYSIWMRDRNLTATGLLDATESMNFGASGAGEDCELMVTRGKVSHDLWHVVTGYDSDLLGEAALLQMTLLQTRNTGLILPTWGAMFAPAFGAAGRRLIWDAGRRSRAAKWLVAADWEALLDRPIDEVREQLGLGDPPEYERVWDSPFR